MGSMFTAAYQEYNYMSTTHADRKYLVIVTATFEQLLTQMMGSSTRTASLSHMVVLLRILFHKSPSRKKHLLRETYTKSCNSG